MLAAVLCLAFLLPATAACLFYLVLTTVGRRPTPASALPTRRFAVLIPAHDEELSLPATLRSVFATDYPADLRRVYVVADNCSDATADVARRAGATVIERIDSTNRGKGYALAFALDRILPEQPDAVLILDADCELPADAFRVFDARLAGGAEVVQAAVATRNADDGPSGFAAAVGNDFDNRTAAGKDRLGLRVPLRGSGMGFRRDVLQRFPWESFGLTEDAEYEDRLAAGGVRVRYEPGVVVRSESPARVADLCRQRRRWRAALFVGGGVFAHWVESKPLVLAQLAATAAVVGAVGSPVFVGWAGVLIALTVAVYLRAVLRVGLTARRVGFLVAAPWVVARLLAVTLGGLVRQERSWERTRRAAEA